MDNLGRLLAIVSKMSLVELRLVLRFAEFLQSKVQKGGKEGSEPSRFAGAPNLQ